MSRNLSTSSFSPNIMRTDFHHWQSLCNRIGADRRAQSVYDALQNAYREPVRAYHSILHIEHCLEELDGVCHLCADPDAVEFALWYHDSIYHFGASNNEEASAERAVQDLEALGGSPELAERVNELILITKHTQPPTDTDSQIIVDIDLSILGQPAPVYDRYEAAIREEYSYLSDETYTEGRSQFLKSVLARKRIFSTDRFCGKYEAASRRNMTQAIERLAER